MLSHENRYYLLFVALHDQILHILGHTFFSQLCALIKFTIKASQYPCWCIWCARAQTKKNTGEQMQFWRRFSPIRSFLRVFIALVSIAMKWVSIHLNGICGCILANSKMRAREEQWLYPWKIFCNRMLNSKVHLSQPNTT